MRRLPSVENIREYRRLTAAATRIHNKAKRELQEIYKLDHSTYTSRRNMEIPNKLQRENRANQRTTTSPKWHSLHKGRESRSPWKILQSSINKEKQPCIHPKPTKQHRKSSSGRRRRQPQQQANKRRTRKKYKKAR